jgi:hypothetical protein
VPIVGAPGTDQVVILLLAALLAEFPAPFVAYTVNVYAVPDVKPLTVIVPDPVAIIVEVIPPGLDTAL